MSSPSNVGLHQESVIAHFPPAERELAVGGELSDFYTLVLPKGPVHIQAERMKRTEAYRRALKEQVPAVFDQYFHDIGLLRKKNPDAQLLGVDYDVDKQKLLAPPIKHSERYRSYPQGTLGMGSMGRRLAADARVEMDMNTSIERRLININDDGKQEYLYIVDMLPSNIEVSDDLYNNCALVEGKPFMRLAVDPTYDQIFTETTHGPLENASEYESALRILNKAFPL